MLLSTKLKALGVESLDTADLGPRRIVLSLEGMEKQGKTHFALTAPKPLVVFDMDIGLEGVLQKFQGEPDILRYKVGEYDTQQAATTAWEGFRQAFLAALEDRGVRTLVLDTATEAWEVIRMARFGKLSQIQPYQYGPVNAEFKLLLKRAYESDKNVVLVHKMRPVYLNDKRSGDYERAGFSDTGYLVQINARAVRDEDGQWTLWIRDCRQNPDLAGMVLEGDMCSFPWLGVSAFPDSWLEDWGYEG